MPKRRANGEGNIRKRKDGRWEGRYTAGYDPESRKTHHQERAGQNAGRGEGETQSRDQRKSAAGRIQSRRLTQWHRGCGRGTRSTPNPASDPSTKAYYTNYIENHIIPGIGDVPVGQADHHPDPAVLQQPPERVGGSSAKTFHRTERRQPQLHEWFAASTRCCTTAWSRRWRSGSSSATPPRAANCRSLRKERNEDPAARENRDVPCGSGSAVGLLAAFYLGADHRPAERVSCWPSNGRTWTLKTGHSPSPSR